WRNEGDKERSKMTSVKCYYKDEIVIFRGDAIKFVQVCYCSHLTHHTTVVLTIPRCCWPEQINKLIENTWHMTMKLKHVGANDHMVAIKNSSDWKKVR